MTFKKLNELLNPVISSRAIYPQWGCPADYDYEGGPPDTCPGYQDACEDHCVKCWSREIPQETIDAFKKELNIISPSTCKVCEADEVDIPDMKETVEKLQKAGEALSLGYKEGIEYPDLDTKTIGDVVEKFNAIPLEQIYRREDLRNMVKEVPEFEAFRNDVRDGIAREFGVPRDILDAQPDPPPELTDPSSYPRVLDSGNRRQFESGAVRDICEGKGRCDLLPLDVVGYLHNFYNNYKENYTFADIHSFQETGDKHYLYKALIDCHIFDNVPIMLLEVSRQFEDGAKKYGEDNWQKGIPTHCYIDSAVRHYLKYLRGDTDEPHDRAFCWNILCCIWTCIHKPELNDYRKEKTNEANQ